jgi:hypothetical protein
MDDETVEDFEFRRTLRDRIARATIPDAGEDTGGAIDAEGIEDDGRAEIVADPNSADDDSGLINLTQKTTIRFVGSKEPVELNFVASRQRSSLIAQIRARREEIETANRQTDVQNMEAVAEHGALMAELDELREAERIVAQTRTIDNVDEFVDRILAHTRWTVGQRYFESDRGLDEA